MKTTLLICSLFLFVYGNVNTATAQEKKDSTNAMKFELSTGISQGLVINRDFKADTYNATISVTPSFVFDKWKFSAVALSYSRNEKTGFFGGTQVSYQVLPGTYLNAHTLFGNTGKELYGGGVGYDFPQVTLFGNLSYETQAEESWIEVGMAYKIIQ